MSDISLTSGMRSNLLSLQSTVKLLDRTQERLATGKKVNSALDNPTNYFTALSHTSRSSDLLGFKDAISEAIQTIKAADAAVKSITTLIESAKALAEDAKSQVGASSLSQTLTLNSTVTVAAGDTITIGGSTFTAIAAGGTVAGGGTGFLIGPDLATTAMNLAATVNANSTAGMEASVSGTTLTLSLTAGTAMQTTTISGGATSVVGDTTTAKFSESAIGTGDGTEAAAKVEKYADFIGQINDMKTDAFYKGKNLLGGAAGGSNDMTVRFGNGHTLTVDSFDGSATSGLGLSATSTNSWGSEADITADITKMESALSTLRIKSSDLSSNLAIINTRNDWITSISNILQTGADNLTLADSNEEGANMLMLQTRQSLSTSALSMSAQAAQSVLQLFQ